MKLFLSRCLVFLLFSVALALVIGPWTDSAVEPVSFQDLLAVVLTDTTDPGSFSELSADEFPRVATTAQHIQAQRSGITPVTASIGLREWKRLCDTLGQAANQTARVRIDGISLVLWHGAHTRNLPVSLPYFGAMRRSIGWILLFFGTFLIRRLYSPPPLLPRSLLSHIILWDLLAVLALSMTAFLILQYLATAVYRVTTSTYAPTAQLVAMALYVPLLPILAALISLPCSRTNPHL